MSEVAYEKYPKVDLQALADEAGADLEWAMHAVKMLYAEVDHRNTDNVKGLELPCHNGCDACCHESVFLTPLEFFTAWDWLQRNVDDAVRQGIIDEMLALYRQNRALIEALEQPPPEGEEDHLSVARQLRFRCPLLGADGACQVYPVRELYARMFGCSFNDAGGVYGCELVGEHLAGREVSLLRVRPTARRLDELPLTGKRQVYPYYVWLLYGDA